MESEFQTFSKYLNKDLTASMEDYIEMIYRLSIKTNYTRINELSTNLNVSPPSATKMIQKLADKDFLYYHKYGLIILKKRGKILGKYLLERHNTIEKLLRVIGLKEENILRETEKIEHTLSPESIICINNYLEKKKT